MIIFGTPIELVKYRENCSSRSVAHPPTPPGFAGFIGQDLNRREDEQKEPVGAPEGGGAKDNLEKRHVAQGQDDAHFAEDPPEEQAVTPELIHFDLNISP